MRNRAVLYVFGSCLLLLLFRIFMGGGIHHFVSAPLIYPANDFTYWLFHCLRIPEFITYSKITAWSFQAALLICCGICMAFRGNRWVVVLFIILLFSYLITYNSYAGHHYHGLFGMLIISLPFLTIEPKRFTFLWKAVRIYLIFIFVSAAYWKIFRGAVFDGAHLSEILKSENVLFLMQQPHSLRGEVLSRLISNPDISSVIFKSLVILQLSFAVALFTRKFDLVLLICLVLFVVVNYLLMGMLTVELLVLGLTLVPPKMINA